MSYHFESYVTFDFEDRNLKFQLFLLILLLYCLTVYDPCNGPFVTNGS